MEKQISLSSQSGILMGFVCVTRSRKSLTGLKEIFRGQATDMSVEGEPQDSGPMWCGSGMQEPVRTILFSFSYPVFMFIQLHSKRFPHELVGGWHCWFPRCKHAYTACFLHNLVSLGLSHILCYCRLCVEPPQTALLIHHFF